jgi:tetratricopeptide (TPR) repeat protein
MWWWRIWLIATGLLACDKPHDRPPPSPSGGSSAVTVDPGVVNAKPPDARPLGLLDEMRALPKDHAGNRADAMALHKSAMVSHGAKDFEAAEKTWAEAARTDPSWDWPFYNLACVASRVGRVDDALAYLEAVHARQPSFEILRRIEQDHDLDAVRARPELATLIKQIANDLIIGSRGAFQSSDPGTLPKLPGDSASGCTTLDFAKDGKYDFDCGAGFHVSGEWAYENGLIFYLATSFHYSGPEPGEQRINDYGVVAITHLADGYLCLGEAHPRKNWPTPRKLGRLVASPERAMPLACLKTW